MKFILLISLFFSTLAFSKSTIAVKALKSDFLSAQESESITNFLTNELSRLATDEKVMAWSDLEEMLKQMGDAAAMAAFTTDEYAVDCLNDKCFEELGGALGVDKILVTDIVKVGSSTIVNMRIIDLARAESKARNSLRVKTGIDGILDGIPELLLGLGYGAVIDPAIQKKQREAAEKKEREEQMAKDAEEQKQAQAKYEKEQKAKREAKQRQNEKRIAQQKAEQDKKEQVRKQEAAEEAAREAALDKQDPNRKIRPWVRYGGLGLGVVGGVLAYLSEQSAANANKNAENALASNDENAYNSALNESKSAGTNRNIGFGLLGLGLVSVGVSFAF